MLETSGFAYRETILSGADLHDHGVAILPGTRDAIAIRQALPTFSNVRQLRLWQTDCRAGVGGHFNCQFEFAVPYHPSGTDFAIRSLVAGFDARKSSAWLRLNQNVFVAGRSRINVDARHHAIHPFTNRAVGIVVERIHPHILKRAVRLLAIPPFPDRRCALLDREEPRWIFLAVE